MKRQQKKLEQPKGINVCAVVKNKSAANKRELHAIKRIHKNASVWWIGRKQKRLAKNAFAIG